MNNAINSKTPEEIREFLSQCDLEFVLYALRRGAKGISGEGVCIPQYYLDEHCEHYGFANIDDFQEACDDTRAYESVDEIAKFVGYYHQENLASEEEAGEE